MQVWGLLTGWAQGQGCKRVSSLHWSQGQGDLGDPGSSCFSGHPHGLFLVPNPQGGKWQLPTASECTSCSKEQLNRNFLIPIPNSSQSPQLRSGSPGGNFYCIEGRGHDGQTCQEETGPQKGTLGGQVWGCCETRKISNMYEPQKFEEQIMVITVT